MPRKKKTAKVAESIDTSTLPASTELASAIDANEAEQLRTPAVDPAGVSPEPSKTPASNGPAYAADPRPTISVSLSGYAGGPAMHLLRSHRFRQMQIRFDQGQPDERHLAVLKRDGWTDRTESEGIWTKQIDPNARWQSVARMEQEFKAIANAIRQERGMEPVLKGLGLA